MSCSMFMVAEIAISLFEQVINTECNHTKRYGMHVLLYILGDRNILRHPKFHNTGAPCLLLQIRNIIL